LKAVVKEVAARASGAVARVEQIGASKAAA
jgi:hypothetical protein